MWYSGKGLGWICNLRIISIIGDLNFYSSRAYKTRRVRIKDEFQWNTNVCGIERMKTVLRKQVKADKVVTETSG
jgi:hypothetical protein